MPTTRSQHFIDSYYNYRTIQVISSDGATKDTTNRYVSRASMIDIQRESIRTPDFGKLKSRSGFLPMNPFFFRKESVYYGQGIRIDTSTNDLVANRPRFTYTTSGCLGEEPRHVLGIPASEYDAMDRQLVNELLAKIKDQKVNLWQVYAEREKTAKLAADLMLRLFKILRALKHGDIVGAAGHAGGKPPFKQGTYNRHFRRNQSKAIAKGWLELQYGLIPLFHDIYGAAEALAKSNFGIPPERMQRSITRNGSFIERRSGSNFRTVDTHTYDVTIKYVCFFRANNPLIKSLSELGITNPSLIAWELMPWSFVIDWFCAIGSFISSWDATSGLTFHSGCKTVFKRETVLSHTTLGPGDNIGGTRSGFQRSLREVVSCRREVLNGFPQPRFPSLQMGLNVKRTLNAIALLRQLF